ncbi:MAG: hypothetical protein KF729_33240 [Sandaracinaceae bacterium]|nr:hypothetical protein [Sandaracinaceae bacterium]
MKALVALVALALAGCGANAPTYAGCTDEADCAEDADACYRLLFDRTDGSRAEGNLCSRGCATDADCPLGGVCLALDGDPSATRFCAAPCARSADCYADFVCTPVSGMDLALCLP